MGAFLSLCNPYSCTVVYKPSTIDPVIDKGCTDDFGAKENPGNANKATFYPLLITHIPLEKHILNLKFTPWALGPGV